MTQLGNVGGLSQAAFPLYTRILNDPKEDSHLVQRVFWLLTQPQVPADRSLFTSCTLARLRDSDAGIRRSALNLLAQIGTARDTVPIAALLADNEFTVSYAAAKALSQIGDDRAVVALDIWLRSDSHKDVRELRDHVRRFRAELQARLDRTAPPPREVKR